VAIQHEVLQEFDLGKLAELAVDDLKTELDEMGGTVQIGELPTIEVEPTQIRLLFQHLIRNAMKFRRSDKPVVRIFSSGCARGTCRIFVEDNGIGFDEKYGERIFRPFQRLHGHGEYSGTGMGLAICRKIAEKHGGNISARSTPGKGSTFIIELPGCPAASERNEVRGCLRE
jgi:signal transduction histidine kinase